MKRQRRWRITIKEVGKEKPIETSHYGFLDYKGVVEFFGLDKPDVEWYDIQELI